MHFRGFDVTEEDGVYSFIAEGAPERSTGWQDAHTWEPASGFSYFFDAEANELFSIDFVGDLAFAREDLDEHLASLRENEADRAEFERDPYAYHGVRRSDFR